MRADGRTQCMRYGGGQTQIRTGDTRIFSPLLYRLSYLATAYRIPAVCGTNSQV